MSDIESFAATPLTSSAPFSESQHQAIKSQPTHQQVVS
jgi:hypothetical protein